VESEGKIVISNNSSFAPLYGDELVKTIDNNVQTRPKSGVWIKEIGQGV
jgi:hypothetical protein